MELQGAKWVVAGATGVIGTALARELKRGGADVALLGRDRARLAPLADELESTSVRFDAGDLASCARGVDAAAAALGGLDGIVLALGAVAFGPAEDTETDTIAALFEVNLLAPIALVGAALRHMESGGAIVGLSATVADHPTAGMAPYSATKAGLSAYLAAVRRERRRRGTLVLDVRPPHMDTGLELRPLDGEAPRLPEPVDHGDVVAAIVSAVREDRREVAWDLGARSLVTT